MKPGILFRVFYYVSSNSFHIIPDGATAHFSGYINKRSRREDQTEVDEDSENSVIAVSREIAVVVE